MYRIICNNTVGPQAGADDCQPECVQVFASACAAATAGSGGPLAALPARHSHGDSEVTVSLKEAFSVQRRRRHNRGAGGLGDMAGNAGNAVNDLSLPELYESLASTGI